MSKLGDQPYFPKTNEVDSSGNLMPDGITIHQEFVKAAMAALISGDFASLRRPEDGTPDKISVAAHAREYADATLAELEKEKADAK